MQKLSAPSAVELLLRLSYADEKTGKVVTTKRKTRRPFIQRESETKTRQKNPEQHQALSGLSSTAMTHHQVHLSAAAVIRAHVAAFEDVLKGIDPDQYLCSEGNPREEAIRGGAVIIM